MFDRFAHRVEGSMVAPLSVGDWHFTATGNDETSSPAHVKVSPVLDHAVEVLPPMLLEPSCGLGAHQLWVKLTAVGVLTLQATSTAYEESLGLWQTSLGCVQSSPRLASFDRAPHARLHPSDNQRLN
jgi:hypothetical protein